MPPKSLNKQHSTKKKMTPAAPRKLKIGQNISSKRADYTILQVIGSGGFGDVYKIKSEKEGEMYAMKTEYNEDWKTSKTLDRLKLEMAVLNDIMECKEEERKKHFLMLVDKGRTEELKFLVMTLVWHSIDILRREYLETISDIKPHNFAIGCPPLDNNIYMIDFGIAHRYREKDGKLRIPRHSVKFLGTVRFASRACHNEKEQGRKDDLESWIYFILDLFNPLNLTWRQESDGQKVLESKHKLLTKPDMVKIDAPEVFGKIISYVNSLQYASDPDYDIIKEYLKIGAKDENCNIEKSFDWVGVALVKKKKREKDYNERLSDDNELWTFEKIRKRRDDKRRKNEDLDQSKSSSEDETPKNNVPYKRSVSSYSSFSHRSSMIIKGGKGRTNANSTKARRSHAKTRNVNIKNDKASLKRIDSSKAGGVKDSRRRGKNRQK